MCCHPRHFALASLLLAASVLHAANESAGGANPQNPRTGAGRQPAAGGTAKAAGSGASAAATIPAVPGGPETGLAVTGVSFGQPYQDPIGKAAWMVVEVDFIGKAPEGARWLDNVDVTLTLGWGTTGARAKLDLSLSASVHLLAVESGKRSAAFFFVPPEALGHGPKGMSIQANQAPPYYAVRFKTNGTEQQVGYKTDVSTTTLKTQEAADGFLNEADQSALKGLMLTEANAPAYLINNFFGNGSHTGGNTVPTFSQNSDAGH